MKSSGKSVDDRLVRKGSAYSAHSDERSASTASRGYGQNLNSEDRYIHEKSLSSESRRSSEDYRNQAANQLSESRLSNETVCSSENNRAAASADEIYFNISQVAKTLDVVPATIRNWEKAGLFAAKRHGNNYRIFDFNDIELLKKIKAYSLEENMDMKTIKKILSSQSLTVLPVGKKYSKSIYNDKLKQYRKMNGYTLEDTARLTGISASYINRIERGQADVSLDILKKLSTLYGESILSFFDIEAGHQRDIVRDGEGIPMETLHKGVEAKSLTNKSDVFQPVVFTVAAGCGDFKAHKHFSGYEFIYVISGKLQITLDYENVYLLKDNDSVNFSATRMHSWHNAGKSTLKMLWIHSPL